MRPIQRRWSKTEGSTSKPTLRCAFRADEIIRWLKSYSQDALETQLEKQTDMETYIGEGPRLNPSRSLIKGVGCGVRVEAIEEPSMREIRYLDKLIDELAEGKQWKRFCGRNKFSIGKQIPIGREMWVRESSDVLRSLALGYRNDFFDAGIWRFRPCTKNYINFEFNSYIDLRISR